MLVSGRMLHDVLGKSLHLAFPDWDAGLVERNDDDDDDYRKKVQRKIHRSKMLCQDLSGT